MSRRESWDPVAERTYIPGGVRPRVHLEPHVHTCPDGTRVVVHAQYIAITDVTLYRWTIDGRTERPTSVRGNHCDVPPDWTAVDAAHRVAA